MNRFAALVFVINFIIVSNSYGAFSRHRVCPQFTQKTWDSNVKKCLDAYNAEAKAQRGKSPVTSGKLRAFCECGADKFVNETTCEEAAQERKNNKLQAEHLEKVKKECMEEVLPDLAEKTK
jgi:hypothetical protein